MTHIGIIGAGNIGTNVAKAALAAGHTVSIANSRGPETLGDLIAELGDGAYATTVKKAADEGEIVVIAVPLRAIDDIPNDPLEGKVVIDANNYYWERDGHIGELDRGDTTTSQYVAKRLPDARIVKVFNNIPADEIATDGTPTGTENRRGLTVYGDDGDAVETASAFVDSIGFDPVVMGKLLDSWRVERDTNTYCVRLTSDELLEQVPEATRVYWE